MTVISNFVTSERWRSMSRVLVVAGMICCFCCGVSAETVLNSLVTTPPMDGISFWTSDSDDGCGNNTHVKRKYAQSYYNGDGHIFLEGYVKPSIWCLGSIATENLTAETQWDRTYITCVNGGTYTFDVAGSLTGMIGHKGGYMAALVNNNSVAISVRIEVINQTTGATVYSNGSTVWWVAEIDNLGWNHTWTFNQRAIQASFSGINLSPGNYICRVKLRAELKLGTKISIMGAVEVWGVVQFSPPPWSPYGPWTWVDNAGFHLDSITITDETPDLLPPTTTLASSPIASPCGERITLTAQDNSGGYGVDSILYRVATGPWTTYTVPFNVSYNTLVEYYAVDIIGNAENVKNYTTYTPDMLQTPVVTCTPGAGYIDLSWNAVPWVVLGPVAYVIYRDGCEITSTGNNHWRDTDPGPDERCYFIRAHDHCVYSNYSGEVCTQISTARLIGGSLNGISATGNSLEVPVEVEYPLEGTLSFGLHNIMDPSNLVPFILVWGWGNHSTSWTTIQGTLPQGTSAYSASVSLTAPATPGTYYLSAAFAPELAGQYVASLTNWQVPGAPHWNDGHDMADWGEDEYIQSLTDHQVTTAYEESGGFNETNVPVAMIKVIVYERGGISGTVSDVSGPGRFGVTVDLYDDGAIIASRVTDVDGYYIFTELIPGSYDVSLLTPLGYVADMETKSIAVASGLDSEANFVLSGRQTVPGQCDLTYWEEQAKTCICDPFEADEPLDSMCAYMNRIYRHFNLSPVNPITAYLYDPALSCLENLEIIKEKLSLHLYPIEPKDNVEDIDDNNAFLKPGLGHAGITMKDHACRQFIVLLLNLASNRMMPYKPISQDGMTVSQAITYCDYLITDEGATIMYDIFGNPIGCGVDRACELANNIAEWINANRIIKEGVIPSEMPDIAYHTGAETDPMPSIYCLEQNYPNPFNPMTTIRFNLPEKTFVTLDIYNITGQKIITLVTGNHEAGTYSVTWDGVDTNGKAMASGVYFYKLQTDQFIDTKKMVLLK